LYFIFLCRPLTGEQHHHLLFFAFNLFSIQFSASRSFVLNRAGLLFVSRLSRAGLPDGKFSDQKSQFGKILEGLVMEDVGIFY
jgi:hypothetical protein